jgi:uncharacterized membrane protein
MATDVERIGARDVSVRDESQSRVGYGQLALAIGTISSGALYFVKHDFYSAWAPVPAWLPARTELAYIFGALMMLGGCGLLLKRTATLSARVLFVCLLLFLVVVKTPVVLKEPQNELLWLGYGQIAVLAAGALTLATTNETYLRAARYLFGAALIPIGLSHFFYLKIATPMVPAMLPFRSGWVIFTGIAHIAAGLGVLAGVYARLATILEAGMITAFAMLVWLGPALASPHDADRWAPFVVSIAVASGAWAVASRYSNQ